MTPSVQSIRNDLVKNKKDHGILMFDAMINRAVTGGDVAYSEKFFKWVFEGSTLLLRDELADPFRDAVFIEDLKKTRSCPFVDCWCAIDSARMHVRLEIEE